MEPAFQSTEPFGSGPTYIEAPDPAYAPTESRWQRKDTPFQLLVYYDPPQQRRIRTGRSGQGKRAASTYDADAAAAAAAEGAISEGAGESFCMGKRKRT